MNAGFIYSYLGLMDFFATEFGFSETEVVALMGVHTLGSAKSTNSGFRVRYYLWV